VGNWCPYITSRGAAQSTTAGATEYIAVGTGSDLIISATEAQRQVPIRQGGTFGTLWVHIGTNATSASSTLTVRKNGADGNQTVTITSGGTGDFSDNTHTDSCTAGDKFNYKTVTGTGGALGVVTVKMDFQSSGSGAYGTFCTGSAVTYTTASATRFNCPAGVSVNTGGTNETLFEFYVRSAATLKNIAAYVSANSWATNASYISRKNGANGNLTVTITAGGTGLFESTANSDTLASGDRFCTAFVTSTGTSKSMTVEFNTIGIENTATTGVGFLPCMRGGAITTTASTTRYCQTSGAIPGGYATAETDIQTANRVNYDYSGLNLNMTANTTTSGSSTVTVRKNATTNTALTVSITSAGTGQFSDTTHTVTGNSASDQLDYEIVTSAGGVLTMRNISFQQVQAITAVIRNVNESVTVTEAVNKLRAVVRNINETITVAEQVNKLAKKFRNINETVTLTEQVNKLAKKVRNINESITLAEAVNRVRGLIRVINEQVTVSEQLNHILGKIRNINESVTLLESVNHHGDKVRVVNEAITLVEAVNHAISKFRVINETVDVTELVNHAIAKTRNINESVTINETVQAILTNITNQVVRNIADDVTVTEAVNFVKTKIRNINEDVTLVEQLNKLAAKVRNITEPVIVDEQINHIRGLTRNISESVTVDELVNHIRGLIRQVNETITLSEAVISIPGKVRVINEVINVTENIVSVLTTGVETPSGGVTHYDRGRLRPFTTTQPRKLFTDITKEIMALRDYEDRKILKELLRQPQKQTLTVTWTHRYNIEAAEIPALRVAKALTPAVIVESVIQDEQREEEEEKEEIPQLTKLHYEQQEEPTPRAAFARPTNDQRLDPRGGRILSERMEETQEHSSRDETARGRVAERPVRVEEGDFDYYNAVNIREEASFPVDERRGWPRTLSGNNGDVEGIAQDRRLSQPRITEGTEQETTRRDFFSALWDQKDETEHEEKQKKVIWDKLISIEESLSLEPNEPQSTTTTTQKEDHEKEHKISVIQRLNKLRNALLTLDALFEDEAGMMI